MLIMRLAGFLFRIPKDEGVLVKSTASAASADLERALWRYGDDLYRLALLLSPDEKSAGRALELATGRVAAAGTPPDEPALIAALVAALPSERGLALPPRLLARLRRPPWARPPSSRHDQAPLLRALARQPRRARLALGMALLRPFDPAQVAELTGGDETSVRAHIRDALRSLAPFALPDLAPDLLEAEAAPEACRPTRAALALGAVALQENGATRAHLALCAACRATEQAWARLTTTVEEALRAALRDVRLPPDLAVRLHEAAQPGQAQPHGPLERAWVRIALVALPVLAAIAFLVLPRGAPPPPGPTGSAGPAGDLHALVERAQAQLYQAPANPNAGAGGAAAWHGQYTLLWNFPDGSSAQLAGNLWIDPANGRHRVQLAHHDGGGPYEFELADGRASAWYAVVQNYAPTLYPFEANKGNYRAKLRATAEQQRAMLDARLRAGAWRTAADYLRQAARAELRTWGRQRDAAGRSLTLVSFRGASPLGFPAGAPEAAGADTTILLAIDGDGRLREVRELTGAAGTEQTARTTWRFDGEEWIAGAEPVNAAFDVQRSWNGVGAFVDTGALASPQLPLVQAHTLVQPVTLLQGLGYATFMPATSPAGATSALALNLGDDVYEAAHNGYLPIIYTGDGRSLALRTVGLDQLAGAENNGELVVVNDRRARLRPALGQAYSATMVPSVPQDRTPVAVLVSASGYTRAELLDVLRSLAPPTLQAYRAQAQLFHDPSAGTPAFEALLGALAPAPAPPAGQVRHIVERAYKRHQPGAVDPLADPYHRRPYGGWPEQWTQESWARGDEQRGTLETGTAMRDSGTLIARQYRGTQSGWDYDALASRSYRYPIRAGNEPQQLSEEQSTVLRMLGCGGYTLQTKGTGARSIVLAEQGWREKSCQNPSYPFLLSLQVAPSEVFPGGADQIPDQAPFLADLMARDLVTVIDLGADGRPARTQVWAGAPDTGTLLEAWERTSEELVPASRAPADAFAAEPPQALLRWQDTGSPAEAVLHEISMDEARRRVQSPLYVVPDIPTVLRVGALAGADPDQPRTHGYNQGESIFAQALREGFAIQFTYVITDGEQSQKAGMIEGAADTLGAYLRDTARWGSSAPATIRIGTRTVDGWRVTEPQIPSSDWLLFELDGTLIAVEQPAGGPAPPVERLARAAP